MKEQDKKSSSVVLINYFVPVRWGGGEISASILLRGEGRVIRGGGGAQKKNLQISDLLRLASLKL